MQSRSKHIPKFSVCQPLFEGNFTITPEWVTNRSSMTIVITGKGKLNTMQTNKKHLHGNRGLLMFCKFIHKTKDRKYRQNNNKLVNLLSDGTNLATS